jgi:hypothetical protein
MVAIGRPSARLALLGRIAGDLPPLLLVLTPIALLNVLVATRPTGAPGPAEADAVLGASGAGAGASADIGFLGQLSVLQVVAGAARDSSLLQSARGICLLAGLVSAALLWPVLRRLGLGGNAATTAVIVAGLGPIALRLQPSVDPGAVAAAWVGLAAAVGFRVRPGPVGRVVVLTALVAAAVTSLVATAGLLAAGAYALAGQPPVAHSRSAPRRRRAVPAAVLAGVAAAASVFPATSGGRPAGAVPLLSLIVLLGLAAAAMGRAWVHRPALRVVVVMVAVWLGCALVPGPARLTALLLAVPALALLGGALLETGATDRSPRLSIAAATAVTVALVSGIVTALWPSGPPRPSSYEPLARWLTAELEPDVVLSAAPLDRAELVAAGVPAERFATQSVPDGAVTVVPADAGCGEVGTPVARVASAAGSLSVCAPPPAARDVEPSAAIGSKLAANPGVRLPDPARQLLQEHRVDGRLAAVLAGAALVNPSEMTNPVEIVDFPAVPGEPPTALRRSAVLAGVIRAVDVNGRPAASALELYLNAQPPPLRPELRPLPDGRVVVHFRLPIGG